MKTMALFAIGVGLYEMLNTIVELFAGGVGGRSGVALLGLMFAVAAGLALAVSGVALIRRGRDAAKLTTRACVTCVLLFSVAAAGRAGLSGMANLAGLAFPLILVGFLMLTRASRSAA